MKYQKGDKVEVEGCFLYISTELRGKLRALSYKTERSVSEIVRTAVTEYMDKPEIKKDLDYVLSKKSA